VLPVAVGENVRQALVGGASPAGLAVLGATLAPVVSSNHAEVRAAASQDQLQAASSQEASMLHEIPQAYGILSTTPNSIDFLAATGGVRQQVEYACDGAQPRTAFRECARLHGAVGAALPAPSTGAPVITNLLDGTPTNPVFGFNPNGFNPTYVTLHLEVPASAGSVYGLSHSIVLNDGAFLRNPAVTT